MILSKLQMMLEKLFPTMYNKKPPVVDVDSSQTTTGSSTLNTTSLEESIINHEGIYHHVYLDTTNNSTIGIGRNVGPYGPGLSTEECIYLLRNDLTRITNAIKGSIWYANQDPVRQGVLIELAFNCGVNGLLTFKSMLISMTDKQYIKAAQQLLDSQWAKQVHEDRATNLANRIRTGTY